MLKEHEREFRYREYTEEPLTAAELRAVLKKLGLGPREILRSRDAKALDLDPAAMDDEALIAAMAEHPTLVERPIGVRGSKAVLGRPPENLLAL